MQHARHDTQHMHPDSGKSGGFFNKVMHLVRGNAGASAPFEASGSDSLSAREVLQEAALRKRGNEAIRQQEFAQLRLLRLRNDGMGGADPAQSAKDDGLSSILGQATRSTETLEKIDAIEAQMSGQWWRQPAPAGTQGDRPVSSAMPRQPSSQQLINLPVLGEDSVVALAVTGLGLQGAVPAAPTPALPARVFKPHPDQEEAAILFAHGDINGARTRLLELLVQALNSAPVDDEKVRVLWHSVLDVCSATGDEEAFEPLAIDYAEHFGRTAPLWSSIPARLGLPALCGASCPSPTSARQFQWSCPALLTVGAVTALRISQQEAPQPWRMSWQRLATIDEAALAPLTLLVSEWAASQGQFVLSDAGQLLELLAQQTSEAQASRNAQWWGLRMAVLRWMNRMQAYEQVALDYCLTYEVSPPSWEAPLCHCVVQEQGEADVPVPQEASAYAQPVHRSVVALDLSKGLAGVIEGDPQDWLDALASQAQHGQVLQVACDNLIRVDFVAAGSLLNWAAEMQNQGVHVQFTQVHQLVAVFFHTIGIHEHAVVQVTRS